jgi:hypothetical protein
MLLTDNTGFLLCIGKAAVFIKPGLSRIFVGILVGELLKLTHAFPFVKNNSKGFD